MRDDRFLTSDLKYAFLNILFKHSQDLPELFTAMIKNCWPVGHNQLMNLFRSAHKV